MSERVDAYMLQENPMQWLKVADKKIEEQANEIAALREQIRQAAGVLHQLRYEIRPTHVRRYYDWLDQPIVRRALEEKP